MKGKRRMFQNMRILWKPILIIESEDELDSECVPEGAAHPTAGGDPQQHTDMSKNGQSEWFSSVMSEPLYSAANGIRIPE